MALRARWAVAALGAYLMGGLAVGGWLLVAAVGGPLAGVANQQRDGVQARVDVALVRAQPEARQAEVLDAYAWADAPDTVRLEGQDAPLPDPAVAELDLARASGAGAARGGRRRGRPLPRVDAVPPTAAAGRSARDQDVRLAAVVQTAAALDAFHPWVDRDPQPRPPGSPKPSRWRPQTQARGRRVAASLRDDPPGRAPPEAARGPCPGRGPPRRTA